jgi:hypothetical protein
MLRRPCRSKLRSHRPAPPALSRLAQQNSTLQRRPTHSENANDTFHPACCCPSTSIAVGIESCRYPAVAV